MSGGRDPRYVVGGKPVNRRTAPRAAAPAPVVPHGLRARMQANRAQARLGPSLREQLVMRSPTAAGLPGRTAVAGAAVAAAGGVGLFLAWLQASALLAGAGLVGLGAGVWLARRRQAAAAADMAPVAPLFDEASLERLEASLAAVASALPAAAAARLRAMQHRLAGIARQGGVPDEHFSVDDRMWVVECVRRYLPDTLTAWLEVPAEQRATLVLEGGQTAEALLLAQLELLEKELAEREARSARSAAESLLRQQRFLAAKHKG